MALGDRTMLMLGAAEAGANGLGRLSEHAELEKPLSPAERYAALVMSGQMSPQEASVRARMEMNGTPQDIGTDQHGYQNRIGSGLSAAPGMSPQGGMFQTGRDFAAAKEVAPHLTRMAVAETQAQARRDTTAMSEKGKDKRTDKTIESREKMKEEELKQRWSMHSQNLKYKYDALAKREAEIDKKLDTAREIANTRVGADQRVDLLRAAIMDLRMYESGINDMVTSFNSIAGDPALKAELEEKLRIAKTKREEAERLMQALSQDIAGMKPPESTTRTQTSTTGSTQKTETQKPAGAASPTKAPTAEDILKNLRGK